jgi:hypothetical protein
LRIDRPLPSGEINRVASSDSISDMYNTDVDYNSSLLCLWQNIDYLTRDLSIHPVIPLFYSNKRAKLIAHVEPAANLK